MEDIAQKGTVYVINSLYIDSKAKYQTVHGIWRDKMFHAYFGDEEFDFDFALDLDRVGGYIDVMELKIAEADDFETVQDQINYVKVLNKLHCDIQRAI